MSSNESEISTHCGYLKQFCLKQVLSSAYVSDDEIK